MATLLRGTTPEFQDRLGRDKLPAERIAVQERTAAHPPAHVIPQLTMVPCFNEE